MQRAFFVGLALLAWGAMPACGGFSPEEDPEEEGPDPGREGRYRTIALTEREACAIRTDGSMACHTEYPRFGDRTEGPPREGSFLDVEPPCALREDGSIVCWDEGTGLPPPPEGTFVRLARKMGTSGLRCALRADHTVACSSSAPTVEVPPDRFVDLATGGTTTCGVREEDATLLCWSPGAPASSPLPGRFVFVAPSDRGGCAVAEDGSMQCWGGVETPPAGRYESVELSSSGYACAIRQDGSMACWGSAAPTPPVGTFVEVAFGDLETVWALDADGHIVSFGDGAWPPPFSRPFVDVVVSSSGCLQRSDWTWACSWNDEVAQPDGAFEDLAMGEGVCGLRREGHLECWGDGAPPTPPAGTFSELVDGSASFCALRDDGEVVCWGPGRLGTVTPPTGPFSSVVASGDAACALTSAGAIRCWGEGSVTADPPAGDGFRAVAITSGRACAIRADGHAQCWADAADWLSPPAGPFANVAISNEAACGLKEADRSLTCWDATAVWTLPPELSHLSLAKIVGCGFAPCAITRDGDVLALHRAGADTQVAFWIVGR